MPARVLKGLRTDSGWLVTEELNHKLGSGGTFCCRYKVVGPKGEEGFLKAMDFASALAGGPSRIQQVANEYVFEQNIVEYCRDKKMTRVVTPMDIGEIKVPNYAAPLDTVYYIIFEYANGDLRQDHFESTSRSWLSAFKTLHHVAIGVHQLHQAGIAHQDIKPSNVLRFDESESKISDLGRVTDSAAKSPFSTMNFTGDLHYAPPEVDFGIAPNEFSDRFYADIYMVGSLSYHLICGAQISFVLHQETENIAPNVKQMSYQDALPFLQTAFGTILGRYQNDCTKQFGQKVSEQLVTILSEMCNPNIKKRGDASQLRKLRRLSMNRYVGKFSNLVRTAKITGIR